MPQEEAVWRRLEDEAREKEAEVAALMEEEQRAKEARRKAREARKKAQVRESGGTAARGALRW